MSENSNAMVAYTIRIRKDQKKYLEEVIAPQTGNVNHWFRMAFDEKKERDNQKQNG